MTYPFSDPLGSGDPSATRDRIRRSHAVVYGAAAPSLLLALLTDGGPLAQRLVTGTAMIATACMALLMLVWRRAPDAALLLAFPLAALTVTAIAALDPPLALTPMYYVWPLMTSAYFLRRRDTVLTYLAVCASFGAASLWALEPGPLLMQWLTVVIVGAVVVGFVGMLTDGLQQLVERLARLAREDPLTGTLNRRAVVARVDEELRRAALHGGSCALAVIDVDHFKNINDRFGHAAGDAALRSLVTTVEHRLRRGDLLGRLGGEEFAVLLAGVDTPGAMAYAEDLRALIALEASMTNTPFTVSIGVAAPMAAADDADALVAAADNALYAAKRAGRDTVRSTESAAAGYP